MLAEKLLSRLIWVDEVATWLGWLSLVVWEFRVEAAGGEVL